MKVSLENLKKLNMEFFDIVDTDSHEECGNSGEDCDHYYGKCMIIAHIEFRKFYPENFVKLIKQELKKQDIFLNEVQEYCLDRLFRMQKTLSQQSSFDTEISQGYYGEEYSVTLKSEIVDSLEIIVNDILDIKDHSLLVKEVLTDEYGYLLEKLEELNKVEVVTIQKDKIVASQNRLRTLDEILAKKIYESHVENSKLPLGVVIKEGNRYRLIDGHTRYTAHTQENIKVILLDK